MLQRVNYRQRWHFFTNNIKQWVGKFKRYDDIHQQKAAQRQQLTLSYRPQQQYTFRFNVNPNRNYQELLGIGLNNGKINRIPMKDLSIQYLPDTEQLTCVPKLKHGLDEHLDGKLFMGDKNLGKVDQNVTQEFLNSLSSYVKPSEDPKLLQLCQTHNCKYFSSTSNITSPLIHLYYLFSQFRKPYLKNILEDFDEPRAHMVSFRKPVTFFLKKWKDGLFSIDSQPSLLKEDNQVLMKMGTYLEYVLTNQSQKIKGQLQAGRCEKPAESYYRYAKVNNRIFLRSQIDCRQTNLVTGQEQVFQIKTRALCPIRYDVKNYSQYLDYPIDSIRGRFFSFEREYYDLIRGGFLKYAFQLKTGNMSGAFVTYHNTQKIFGYEYIPLKEIAFRLFGNQYNMDLTYMCTNEMLSQILQVLSKEFPQQETKESTCSFNRLKIGFYANSARKCLTVFVQKMINDKLYSKLPQQYEQDVYTYFKKFCPLKNPVYKYEFQFFIYQNNVLMDNSQTFFEPTDNIRMEWRWKNTGEAMQGDYLNFLTDAYKIDSSFGVFNYGGVWARSMESD